MLSMVSFAGKCSHVATLVQTWRPFLNELWAAFASAVGQAPPGTIWRAQIDRTLDWIEAVLASHHGGFSRTWDLSTHLGEGVHVTVTLDASPYGLGATLAEDDEVV